MIHFHRVGPAVMRVFFCLIAKQKRETLLFEGSPASPPSGRSHPVRSGYCYFG